MDIMAQLDDQTGDIEKLLAGNRKCKIMLTILCLCIILLAFISSDPQVWLVGLAVSAVTLYISLRLLRHEILKNYCVMISDFSNTLGGASVLVEHCSNKVMDMPALLVVKNRSEDLFERMCKELSISQRDIRNILNRNGVVG